LPKSGKSGKSYVISKSVNHLWIKIREKKNTKYIQIILKQNFSWRVIDLENFKSYNVIGLFIVYFKTYWTWEYGL